TSPAPQPVGCAKGSHTSPAPMSPSPQVTAQAVQSKLHDSPAGQLVGCAWKSQTSPSSTVPLPQREHVVQPKQTSSAAQPFGWAEGSHVSPGPMSPSPQNDAHVVQS